MFSSSDSLLCLTPDVTGRYSLLTLSLTARIHVPLVCITIPYMLNCGIISSEINFRNLPCQIFEKIKFSFSPNAQLLRLWKSHLTQNWVHSTIFQKLFISFSKCTYATSYSYVFPHRSRILPVSISWLSVTSPASLGLIHLYVLYVIRAFLPTQQLYRPKRLSSLGRHM